MSNEGSGIRDTLCYARPSYSYSLLIARYSSLVTHRSSLVTHCSLLITRVCRRRVLWGIITGGSSKEGEACSYSITKDLAYGYPGRHAARGPRSPRTLAG